MFKIIAGIICAILMIALCIIHIIRGDIPFTIISALGCFSYIVLTVEETLKQKRLKQLEKKYKEE